MLTPFRLQALLLEICSIDSETGQEEELATWIEKKLATSTEFISYREGNSLVYQSIIDNNKQTIAFYGHLDTVANQQEKPPYIDESTDKLYACGASDMKSGVAVMLALMETSPSVSWNYNLQFVFYDKEEGPYNDNGLGTVLDKFKFLQQADIAFVLEPTDNEIHTGCVGTMNLILTWLGKVAHSARPWEGKNALHAAGSFINYLNQQKATPTLCQDLTFYESKQLTTAQAGKSKNVLPDSFRVNLNYRFTPNKNIEESKQEILSFLASYMLEKPTEITQISPTEYCLAEESKIEIIDMAPSAPVVKNAPLLAKFIAKYNCVIAPKQAWTDIARLALYNIDAVNFGPGSPSQAHQKNEYILLQNLENNYSYFLSFLTTTDFSS